MSSRVCQFPTGDVAVYVHAQVYVRTYTHTHKVSSATRAAYIRDCVSVIKMLQVHHRLAREAEILRRVFPCLAYRSQIKTKTVPQVTRDSRMRIIANNIWTVRLKGASENSKTSRYQDNQISRWEAE